jgi:hypothetical protein
MPFLAEPGHLVEQATGQGLMAASDGAKACCTGGLIQRESRNAERAGDMAARGE